MVTAVIIAACFVVVGLMRSALQWLVAWVLGARPLHLIVGIGPALVRRDVGGTPFEIRAVPLGGHVQWGDTPYVVPAPGPWGARLALALSGPLATVILAFFLLFGLHVSFQARTVDGRPVATNVVALPLNTAVAAGIRPGDVITQIDGQSVEFYDEITALVGRSGGRALQVTVQRPPPGPPGRGRPHPRDALRALTPRPERDGHLERAGPLRAAGPDATGVRARARAARRALWHRPLAAGARVRGR